MTKEEIEEYLRTLFKENPDGTIVLNEPITLEEQILANDLNNPVWDFPKNKKSTFIVNEYYKEKEKEYLYKYNYYCHSKKEDLNDKKLTDFLEELISNVKLISDSKGLKW